MSDGCSLILSAVSSHEHADALARKLLDEDLAACVSVGSPCVSHYRWEGELEREEEFPLLIKTARDKADLAAERLEELHPYDCPEVLTLPVQDSNKAYRRWLEKQVFPEDRQAE